MRRLEPSGGLGRGVHAAQWGPAAGQSQQRHWAAAPALRAWAFSASVWVWCLGLQFGVREWVAQLSSAQQAAAEPAAAMTLPQGRTFGGLLRPWNVGRGRKHLALACASGVSGSQRMSR